MKEQFGGAGPWCQTRSQEYLVSRWINYLAEPTELFVRWKQRHDRFFLCTVVRITLVGNASFLGTSPANGNPDTSNTWIIARQWHIGTRVAKKFLFSRIEWKLLPVLGDFPQRVRASYQFVQGLSEIGKGRTMGSFLLPAIEHQLIDRFRTIHRCWKPVSFFDRLYHILIRPVPIRSFAVGHHLPTNDAHAPYVGSAGELSERYRFRSCPSYRDLSTLFAGVNSLSRFDIWKSRFHRRDRVSSKKRSNIDTIQLCLSEFLGLANGSRVSRRSFALPQEAYKIDFDQNFLTTFSSLISLNVTTLTRLLLNGASDKRSCTIARATVFCELTTYPGRVRSFRGAFDLPAKPEIGDLADEGSIHEHVPRREISMYVVHFSEILHAARYTAKHAYKLQHLELAVVRTQESVQATVLHELSDDHHWIALGYDTLQEYHVRMLELTHDGGFSEEVVASFVGGAWFQCLDRDVDLRSTVWR